MYKILKDNKVILSEIPGKYAGYKKDKIFGLLSCKSGMRMKKENRVFFHTLEDAVKQGYRPCKNCKPIDEKDFETIKHLVPEKTLQEFYNRPTRMKYKHLKTFEEFNPVEFVAPEREHPSYKNEDRKKRKKKKGEHIAPVEVPPNHTKDVISFKVCP
jgi:hypothetical protein